MKKAFLFFLITFFVQTAFLQSTAAQINQADLTQYGIRVEPDKRLILVMATLEAAGINTSLTETGKTFRQKLRGDLQNIPVELRDRINNFVGQYRKKHSTAGDAEFIAP
ncbi:MAG: hypothetical protein ACR2L1_00900, partial [Pyrinomonadaceae bacterium]